MPDGLRCPYCGGEDVHVDYVRPVDADGKVIASRTIYWWLCPKCEASGPTCQTEEECIKSLGAFQLSTDLLARIAALEAQLDQFRAAANGRLMKLLREGRQFFVVRSDEPYAARVVSMIKQHEGDRWTAEDERWASNALNGRLEARRDAR